MVYDIYLLQLCFHSVAEVGTHVQNRKVAVVYQRRSNTANTKHR